MYKIVYTIKAIQISRATIIIDIQMEVNGTKMKKRRKFVVSNIIMIQQNTISIFLPFKMTLTTTAITFLKKK